jgi:hypothetical protein
MKRTFKDWIFYKTKRTIVYFKLRQRNLIRTIAQPKKKELSEIQKPLFSISLRLIPNFVLILLITPTTSKVIVI